MGSLRGAKLGSSSNHDDDGNKNHSNLHIGQWKTVFLHSLYVHFSSFDILKTLSFFQWREMTFFVVVWTTWREHMMTNVQFCLAPSAGSNLIPAHFSGIKAHFSGIMTLNNWKVIAETRSDIFRWRSRFRRRRVCLNSLLIRPYERPTGPGLTWQTTIEGRHCMEPASWELISY